MYPINTILITGAALGIGREMALLFAQKGWFVILCDIDEQALRRAEKEMEPHHKWQTYQLDVTDYDAFSRVVSEVPGIIGGRTSCTFQLCRYYANGAV